MDETAKCKSVAKDRVLLLDLPSGGMKTKFQKAGRGRWGMLLLAPPLCLFETLPGDGFLVPFPVLVRSCSAKKAPC